MNFFLSALFMFRRHNNKVSIGIVAIDSSCGFVTCVFFLHFQWDKEWLLSTFYEIAREFRWGTYEKCVWIIIFHCCAVFAVFHRKLKHEKFTLDHFRHSFAAILTNIHRISRFLALLFNPIKVLTCQFWTLKGRNYLRELGCDKKKRVLVALFTFFGVLFYLTIKKVPMKI